MKSNFHDRFIPGARPPERREGAIVHWQTGIIARGKKRLYVNVFLPEKSVIGDDQKIGGRKLAIFKNRRRFSRRKHSYVSGSLQVPVDFFFSPDPLRGPSAFRD